MRSALRPALVGLERYAFLLFCSHVIVFMVCSVVGSRIFGSYHDQWYWIYFLLQPLIATAD